jgi:hypothetical protein
VSSRLTSASDHDATVAKPAPVPGHVPAPTPTAGD